MDEHFVMMVLSNYWTECEQQRINTEATRFSPHKRKQAATEELARRLGIHQAFNDEIKQEERTTND